MAATVNSNTPTVVELARNEFFSTPLPKGSPERCEYCGRRAALKTDGNSKMVCRACLNGPPIQHKVHPVGRNELCPCGSGNKFKRCCGRHRKGTRRE
jgi:hypothetical protein